MALSSTQAHALAKELMLAVACSISLKRTGESNGDFSSDEKNKICRQQEGVYLAALYLEIVNELQK